MGLTKEFMRTIVARARAEVRKPSKSLHRMLAARGNPSTENFFGIVKALQKKTRTRLSVTSHAT